MTTENYHVGGNVPKDHPSYVYRQADEQFYQALLDRQFCYVLNARQMGKSSLLVRTRERLRQAGVACATVDITQIGSDSTLIQWYAGIIRTILDDFHWDDFDLTEWWESHDFAPLSPLNHLSQFIEKVLLVRTEPQPVVIFIDETDAMRRFGEDFFAMIRSCYNLRADKPAYQRLTFAILGVVSPSDLIQDKGKTPFNIGKGIELTGFQLAEAVPLLAGLETSGYPAEALLSLILQWTGGQPFLTQKVCRLVREAKPPLFPLLEKEGMNNVSPLLTKEGLGVVEPWLTQLLQEKIINNWEAQDEPAHLRNIRDRLLQKDEKNRARLLGVYQRILHTGGIPADGSSEQMELRLSGAVVQREGVLRPYNPIYAQVFGEQWVSAQLAAVRPYSEALQGWLGSTKQEASFLLRGQALQEAETWAQDKSLSDDDYRFLQASQALAQKEVEKNLRAKAQKRLILVLAVALVVAVGLTVWAFSERQRAESERQHAQQVEQMRTESLFDSQLTHASLLAKGGVEDYAAAREVLNESRPLDPEVDPARRHARNLLAGFVNLMGGTADKVYEGAGVPLLAVAVSPDGRLVAATGEKGTVVLFDAESGQLVKRLEGHDRMAGQNGSVWTVVFQPQGHWLATAGEDQRIILWHLTEKPPSASDRSVEKWLDWQAPAKVNALAVSPNGKLLASGGDDNNISVWEVSTLEKLPDPPLRTLTGHTETISTDGLAFSPDGTQLASASYDDTARVWDVATGETVQTLRGHTAEVLNIAFSPEGQQLATSSTDKTVRLWNTATGESVRVLAGHQNEVFSLRFTAAGHRLISASFDRTLRVWDPDTGVTVRVLQGHTAGVGNIALHGDSLFSASNDGTVRRWGVGLNRSPNLTGLEDLSGLKRSPNSPNLTGLQDLSGFMKVMDLPTEPASVAIAPDGHSLVVGFADGALRLYALPDLQLLVEEKQAHSNQVLRRLAFNPKGTLLASSSHDYTAKLWEVKDNLLKEQKTFKDHNDLVHAVAFSPDSTLLATASYDGQIGVFTLGTEKQRLFKAHDGRVASVTFDNTGTRLLSSGNEDQATRLWTLTTDPPTLLREFPKAQDKLLWATLSPDQQWVASVGRGSNVTLYNATEVATVTPPVPLRLVGHEQTVYRAIFSPDSSQLATVSMDATVKLWAVKTGKELFALRLPTHSGWPTPLWDFDFRCVPQGNCWIAVPLTRGQLVLYNLGNYE